MGFWNGLLANRVLIAGISGWATAQVIKAILYTILNREFSLERLFGDGGMPSGHSATVSAMATMSLLHYGIGSFEFAVTAMLAIIVMHDAMGVRLETGKQAEVINELRVLLEEIVDDFNAEETLDKKFQKVFAGFGALFAKSTPTFRPSLTPSLLPRRS